MNQDLTAPWTLEGIPAYEGGVLAPALYDCGKRFFKHGDDPRALLQAIAHTDAAQFDAYVKKLAQAGFAIESDNSLEANRYVTAYDGATRVYASFAAAEASARVVKDISLISPDGFSQNESGEGEAMFCLFGLNRDAGGHNRKFDEPEWDLNKTDECNAGLLMVIRCTDNSLILIDGGITSQMTGVEGVCEPNAPMRRLDAFLRKLTATPDGERIRIACWYMTHADSDHYQGLYNFLKEYSNSYTLERFCSNIPATSAWEPLDRVGAYLGETYPECRELKLHTGQKFTLAGVTLQAIYTHEDDVDPETGIGRHRDNNSSSLVMRVSAKDMSMLILGDATSATSRVLQENFTNRTLGVDIMQVAHHGFNNVKGLYDVICADHALFPQAQYGVYKDYPQNIPNPPAPDTIRNIYQSVVNSNPNGIQVYFEVYYADRDSTDLSAVVDAKDVTDPVNSPLFYQTHTWGFSAREGKPTLVLHDIDVFPNRR